ncbi:MAG: hypothetical protein AAFR61_24280, partial [Bacteroidota bacterium]
QLQAADRISLRNRSSVQRMLAFSQHPLRPSQRMQSAATDAIEYLRCPTDPTRNTGFQPVIAPPPRISSAAHGHPAERIPPGQDRACSCKLRIGFPCGIAVLFSECWPSLSIR